MAALFSAFFLPFWNLTSTTSTGFDSLYTALRFTLYNFQAISQTGVVEAILLAVVLGACLALVAVSGVLGAFPGKAGVVGVAGMLGLTLGPILLYSGFDFSPSNYGAGFWALWVLSIVNIFAGLAVGRKPKPAAAPKLSPSPPAEPSALAPEPIPAV